MTTRVDILGLTSDAARARAHTLFGRGAGFTSKIYGGAMREARFAPEDAGAGVRVSAAWREHFHFAPPTVASHRAEPTAHGTPTEKVSLRAADDLEFEIVRIPLSPTRESICISSQIGCRMACRFCETGRMGLLRNLTAGEIVSQVVVARSQLGWRPGSIVFMGMGEPLDNLDALVQALRVLTDRRGLRYARERLTVCTVGRAAGIDRLAALGWKRLNIALSLNATDDERRREIMPHKELSPLAELRRALSNYRARDNLVFSIHYCLLPGINDRRADAAGIARFCDGLGRALVHLIPYNPGTHPLTRPPTEPEIEQFVGWLRAEGLSVRRRITKGRSVMAACGQLGNVDLRRATSS